MAAVRTTILAELSRGGIRPIQSAKNVLCMHRTLAPRTTRALPFSQLWSSRHLRFVPVTWSLAHGEMIAQVKTSILFSHLEFRTFATFTLHGATSRGIKGAPCTPCSRFSI